MSSRDNEPVEGIAIWTKQFLGILALYGGAAFAILFLLGYQPEANEFFRNHRELGVIGLMLSYILFLVHKWGSVEDRIIRKRREELKKEVDK